MSFYLKLKQTGRDEKMQIFFLNTFEKSSMEEGVQTAQLSICEHEGIWSVLWADGEHTATAPDVWFEGISWEDMLLAFRHGVAVRMGEGYTPVIESMLEGRRNTGMGSSQAMVQCYGELNADQALFEQLRDWRRAKAGEEKRSAYLIATNRMLWMFSTFVPHTAEELLQIPGWGESKQNRYGSEILAITENYARETSFPLDWVEQQLDKADFTRWLYKQKEVKFKNEMDKQLQKKRILSCLNSEETLEQLGAGLELSRREVMDRIEQLEAEGYDVEPLIARELLHMPESEQQLVWETFEQSGDRYLKPVLQQVYGAEGMKHEQVDMLYERLRLLRIRYRKAHANQAQAI
ncbi:HRDC domain-containing protein [Paenibacillus sp. Leaf72]|uniref:HRDC domain-containing protein n=1 Tax=Paenibacillus sp. Leaf72 TaxID=1736234 RepID=UPI000A5B23D4|nr:HRDC domain-containing protein [Paenibacillus sp. Leaf72]